MTVRLLLASGGRRELDADGAHMDGPFFIITRWDARLQSTQTVLTLRACDVVSAEIQTDGVSIEFVFGAGVPPRKE